MSLSNSFEVKRYDFNQSVFEEFENVHSAKGLWPVVYILTDGTIKEAYVGETTDTYARMSSHLKSSSKNKLTAVHLITSEKFNKSATLDIESNLIKYMSGDGQYKLINGNIGLANHNYYQKKEVYWDIFKSIWDRLRAEGISRHAIGYINNSDLFKYSPYKNLTDEQRVGLLSMIKSLLSNEFKNIIVEGGAGTGKTILAIFLFKLIYSNNDDFNFKEFGEDESEFIELILALKRKYPSPKMALVVPMSSFRNTLKKVFKNIKGLNANMVIGPAEVVRTKFDIIVVDESHRLRRRVNLGTYFHAFDVACEKLQLDKSNCSELDWIVKQSATAILFYDQNQSIKPSDVKSDDFVKLKANKSTKIEYLKSQFRVKGGNNYVSYIDRLLNCKPIANQAFSSKDYEFLLFNSIEDMVSEIKLRDSENGLSRLIAGYSWPWISKNDKSLYDIKIENLLLQWNSVSDDFINSANAINEVGCIHTTQGYDLNYAGIILGNEISYDKERNEIVIFKENYFDKNGKQSIGSAQELKDFIINIYKTIMLRGIKGTYIYVCDIDLREYFSQYVNEYKTEIAKPVYLPQDKVVPFVNSVPVYDLKAAAGSFGELQNVSDCNWIVPPPRYRPSNDLFACTVIGESMNKVIPNGVLCLFRKYSGGSKNGKIVLAEHTNLQDPDFGSSYTVKEYHSKKNVDTDQWSHLSITLKPLSINEEYHDIEIVEDELIRVRVIGIFECVL